MAGYDWTGVAISIDGSDDAPVIGGDAGGSVTGERIARLHSEGWDVGGFNVDVQPVPEDQLITNAATGQYQVNSWRQFGAGEPYNELLARIGFQANADIVVFGGMGLIFDDYHFFRKSFEDHGVFHRTVMYVNQASDPIVERLLVPDLCMAVAERFAVEENKRVLVLLTDITERIKAERALEREQEHRVAALEEASTQRELLAHANRVSTMEGLASSLAHDLNQPLAAILRPLHVMVLPDNDPLLEMFVMPEYPAGTTSPAIN